jgi:hypothetical protein
MRDESAPPLFAYRTEVTLRSDHRSARPWAAWLLAVLALLGTALLGYGVFLWLLRLESEAAVSATAGLLINQVLA